uniref:Uncharacterized protein n=1 Tax=Populus trichocarpa TaxID=3694 RepID=A0A3N7F3D5_POPTR
MDSKVDTFKVKPGQRMLTTTLQLSNFVSAISPLKL